MLNCRFVQEQEAARAEQQESTEITSIGNRGALFDQGERTPKLPAIVTR